MSDGRRDSGTLCIVLHSHMPYVEGFGTWPFGEEWLLEATASSYLPLLQVLEEAAQHGARDVATVGVTPVLADQLALPEVGQRFLAFMRTVRRECHDLDAAGLDQAGQHAAAEGLRRSARDYEWAADNFERRGGDLLAPLRRLRDGGVIDLWASSATHAVLPLLATEAGVRLQLDTGIAAHRARFGGWSGGFWVPECAYRPGLEEPLAAAGVRAFCVDQTNVAGPLDQLEPVTAGGSVAIPLDWSTIALVWDERGYPSDPTYRDYHAQTVNGMRAWANSGAPYDHAAAAARARDHAHHFVEQVIARASAYRVARGRPALITCALDTELLGHWWYEGPTWLAEVIAEAGRRGLALATLPDALARHEPRPGELGESTWGIGRDLRTWDSREVADYVWAAREAEVDLIGALGTGGRERDTTAARRAARELLALQSSDWAFMETRALAGDYPRTRVRDHGLAFGEAIAVLRHGVADFRAMRSRRGRAGSPNGNAAAALDERLRGLAPGLDLGPLFEPGSPWGRES